MSGLCKVEEMQQVRPDICDSCVETGAMLLERLLHERRRNWNGRGKYKDPTPLDTSKLPPLPPTWVWASPEQLSAADAYSLAIGPFGSNLKVSDYRDSGVPLVFVRNIRAGRFGGDGTIFVSDAKAAELKAHQVSGGDLLITKMGDPPGDACMYPESAPDAVITADCIKLRLSPLLDSREFFVYAINSRIVRTQILEITKGVAQLKVSLGRFATVAIPLPPLAEQQRIVAEIEKQFTRLDAGVTALRRMQANLKRYRAAVLKAACEGLLVPTEAELARQSGRPYEPASDLLARTPLPPRPNRWNSRSKDVVQGHPALAVGLPDCNVPEGWSWTPLVNIARMESGHTPSREHPEWWDGDVPWIGIADAREHDGRVIHDTLQHTNTEGLANSAARLLPAGTVCVSRTASVGYVVVMGQSMATSQDFVNWTPTFCVTSDWLRIVLSADREALRRFGKGSVHKTIYFPEWLSVHVALPPHAEQIRIANEVERRLSVVTKLQSIVDTDLHRASRLRSALLHKAFSGKL